MLLIYETKGCSLLHPFFTSFNQVMDPISINNATFDGPSSISLLYFGEDGNASPVEVSLGYNSSLNQTPYRYYRVGSNDLSLVLESPLTWGRYQLIVDSTAVNPFGSELDGNGDGVGGDDLPVLLDSQRLSRCGTGTPNSGNSLVVLAKHSTIRTRPMLLG